MTQINVVPSMLRPSWMIYLIALEFYMSNELRFPSTATRAFDKTLLQKVPLVLVLPIDPIRFSLTSDLFLNASVLNCFNVSSSRCFGFCFLN